MVHNIFRRKGITEWLGINEKRLFQLETDTKLVSPVSTPTITQTLSYLFESTSFTQCSDNEEIRINNTITPTSLVDEETLASVAAYATFDDVGGNAASSADVLGDATLRRVPMLDGEAKVAYYRGHPSYLNWDNVKHPTVTHTRQFLAGHSFELNVSGTVAADQKTFAYYDSNAAFNISASISVSLWFYPTDTSQIASETFRYLLYRWIDASNYFQVLLNVTDQKVYVFTDEAAAVVKLVSNATVNLNAWNLIIFTYNPSTNALVMYLNNDSTSSTPSDTPTTPYTANANMYLGGLPGLPDKRFTGYIDNFVFWTGKILTGTEATNMWNHGTIV